jgi:hypothetical protein
MKKMGILFAGPDGAPCSAPLASRENAQSF